MWWVRSADGRSGWRWLCSDRRFEVTGKDLRLHTPTVPSSAQVQQEVMAFTALLMLSTCLIAGSLHTLISTGICGIYAPKLLHLQNVGSFTPHGCVLFWGAVQHSKGPACRQQLARHSGMERWSEELTLSLHDFVFIH